MNLSDAQKKFLRGLGHRLKPVISIADAGLTKSVFDEFTSTIEHHELIKVRVRNDDRNVRNSIVHELCEKSEATLITRIGNVALIFKKNDQKPYIALPR